MAQTRDEQSLRKPANAPSQAIFRSLLLVQKIASDIHNFRQQFSIHAFEERPENRTHFAKSSPGARYDHSKFNALQQPVSLARFMLIIA